MILQSWIYESIQKSRKYRLGMGAKDDVDYHYDGFFAIEIYWGDKE